MTIGLVLKKIDLYNYPYKKSSKEGGWWWMYLCFVVTTTLLFLKLCKPHTYLSVTNKH